MKTFTDYTKYENLNLKSKDVFNHKSFIFVVIKPGFENLSKIIIDKFNSYGWKINKMKTKLLQYKEAKSLYLVHKDEPFYEDLCKYMSSAKCTAIIFDKNQPMTDNIFKETDTIKDDIRNKYKVSDMKNVIHSSDSLDSMLHEVKIFFNGLN